MTEDKKAPPESQRAPPSSQRLPPRGSGPHPILSEVRRRLESFDENTMPLLLEAADRMQAAVSEPPDSLRKTTLASEWSITIRGNGPHHNHSPTDANLLARLFVAELIASGQVVVSASFDNGSREDVTIPSSPPPPAPTPK